jgi:hypothetical protein
VAYGLPREFPGTIDALTDAAAFEAGMFINAGALELVVFRLVGEAADAAGDERRRARAPLGVVPKAPAALTLFNEGE